MIKRGTKLFFRVLPAFVDAYSEGCKISAPVLEEKYKLHARSLTPVLQKLVLAGILESQVGGLDHGYTFRLDPKDVSVYDIIKAVQLIPYVPCSFHEYLDGKDCQVCSVINNGLDCIVDKLSGISCFDFSKSLQSSPRCQKNVAGPHARD